MSQDKDNLFFPHTDKDLRQQYPELNKIPAFKKLTTPEMMFVRWFACPTSSIALNTSLSEKEKAVAALRKSWKQPNESRDQAYYSLNFPEHVRIAIEVMQGFRPDMRTKARMMVEQMFNNLQSMIGASPEDFTYNEVVDGKVQERIDWDGRSKYINMCSKTSETLPSLIKQLEEGFGISETASGEEDSGSFGSKAIDRFHKK